MRVVARLVVTLTAFAAFAACGPGKAGQSICDNTVPPPAACMSQCDPSPSAANSCPSGYHCAADGFCDALCTPGGNQCGDGYTCTADGRCKGEGDCEGLECNVTACQSQGKPETSISGTVFAPNGTLPLYGITVYIPNAPLPAMPDGAQCSRCSDDLPGQPLARATTDESGHFVIQGNVPAGANIPLVITSGKWRRQITIPSVSECADTAASIQDTRLPKNKMEGDIPKIAVTTGSYDSLECLIRKLGIDDAEITTGAGAGRVHLYQGNGVGAFKAGWPGGAGAMTSATNFWDDSNKLKPYDIVILSCEGEQMGTAKDQGDLNAMRDYADIGGRVFASHWHNVWIGGYWETGLSLPDPTPDPVIADWAAVATWKNNTNPNPAVDVIDEVMNPKGVSFANWMKVVEPNITRGEIPLAFDTERSTVTALTNKAERWTYTKGDGNKPQNFQFTTPQNVAADQRCGKVVFSDMHVSGMAGGGEYPDSCVNANVFTPQEKALAFMLFDLASCVGVLL